MFMFQEVDESGAEGFTVLLPSGIPLPARRHYILSGEGKLSSLSLDIYHRFVMQEPEKLAKVQKRWDGMSNYILECNISVKHRCECFFWPVSSQYILFIVHLTCFLTWSSSDTFLDAL